ncbi:THAP domain-containing protein 5 isoform X1 [Xenopus laevis]|nr:THAP domain-containing protein 5 isoform X1 [Xenopus laevis]
MKQYKLYPTKHQVLCSDHFTADSFNIRWGIQYLKPNAIPTLFSFTEKIQDIAELELTIKEGTQDGVKVDTDTVPSQDFCPNVTNNLSHGFDTDEYVDPDDKQVYLKNTIDGITVSQNKTKDLYVPNSEYEIQPHLITPSKFRQTSVENMIVSSVADLNSQSNQVYFELQTDQNYVAENVDTFQVDHFSDVQKETFPLSLVKQTKQMDAEKDSVITIIVPGGQDGSAISDNLQFTSSEKLGFENDANSTNEILESEHSYCRQITDRHYLRQKIAKLQSKIAVLEAQENATLSRLRLLESVIAKLKQENLLSDEKLKILENCGSSVDIVIV